MRVNNNISAMTAQNSLSKVQGKADKSMQKLSTGLRINSAADDAAGMAISNKLRTQVKGLKMASRNSLDGISLVQTAEGALSEVQNMLQRMRELAIQSSNDTLQSEDRAAIQAEINQLLVEIDDTSKKTEFNKIKLLNGDCSRATASSNSNAITCTYTSALVNPGMITYTIVKAGTPAALISDTTSFDDASLAEGLYAGKLMVNGETIVIDPSDDKTVIANKLKDICDRAGVEILVTGGASASWTDWINGGSNTSLLFVTKDAGSNQKLDIISNNTMLITALGFTEGYNDSDKGSDAVITNVKYNGKDVLSSANGNEITISADASQVIRININTVLETSIEGGEYRLPMDGVGGYITISLGAAETAAQNAANKTAIAAAEAANFKSTADDAASKFDAAISAIATAISAFNTAITSATAADNAISVNLPDKAIFIGEASIDSSLAYSRALTAYNAAKAAISAAQDAKTCAGNTLDAAQKAKVAADKSAEAGDKAADEAAIKAGTALFDAQAAYAAADIAAGKAGAALASVESFFVAANYSISSTVPNNAAKAAAARTAATTVATNLGIAKPDVDTTAALAAIVAISTAEAAEAARIAADSGNLNDSVISDLELRLLDFGPLVLHVGPNENMTFDITIPKITSEGLRIKNINLRSRQGAEMAIPMVDEALTRINEMRARLGAYQNRLEYTISNLDKANENATSALSRIEDTDMAESMTEYTQQNVLSQAGISILSQANQRPQQILQLLQ